MKKIYGPLIAILVASGLVVLYVGFRIWLMRNPEIMNAYPFFRDDAQILPRIVVGTFVITVVVSVLIVASRKKWIAAYQTWIGGLSTVKQTGLVVGAIALIILMKWLGRP